MKLKPIYFKSYWLLCVLYSLKKINLGLFVKEPTSVDCKRIATYLLLTQYFAELFLPP